MNPFLLAHASDANHVWSNALRTWTFDVWVVALLALCSTLYALGATCLRAKERAALKAWQWVCFFSGILTVIAALLSPLDGLSDLLFSAHMGQHELLMLIAAPLLVLGRPLYVWLWALPPPLRLRVAGWTRTPVVRGTWRALTAPWLIALLHGAVVWMWHLPSFFEAALHHEGIHALQHTLFFLTAALFWWTLIYGRYGRMGYGLSVLYVFVTALHTGALGAFATFAREAWYPSYVERAPTLATAPLEDQQLAGLLMWIPAGAVLAVFGLALFAAWMGEVARRGRLSQTRAQTEIAAREGVW
jgi:putative membrane protein